MEEKLNELIRENLPQQIGEQLQKELEDLKQLRQSDKDKDETIKNQQEEIQKLKALEIKQLELDQQQIELSEYKKQLDIQRFEIEKELSVIQAKKESLAERNSDIFSLVNSLTRNTSFRKSVFESTMDNNCGYTDSSGTYHPPKNETKNTTETVDQD